MKRTVRVLALLAALILFVPACTPSIPPAELEKKHAGVNSKFIDIDGVRTHYRDEGTGPVIVMLHGIVSSLHTWDGWTAEMKGTHRIIRFDLPGFGLTGPGNFHYKPGLYVQFLEKFVDKLGLDKFVLVGNSLGGFISWSYAVKHPDKVTKLILVDPVGYPQDTPWIVDMVAMPVVGNAISLFTPRFIVEQNVREVYGDSSKISTQVMDRYYELILREGNREAIHDIFVELKDESGNASLGDAIKELKVPTMVMWGDKDKWAPFKLIKRWKQDLPQAEYRVYEGVGHVPMEEIPQVSARDAEAFMNR